MASTTAQNLSIRASHAPIAFPALSGDTFYHGTIAVVAADTGCIENMDSATTGSVPVIVDNINGGCDQAGTASTGAGSITNGESLITAYADGYIDSIPFNSDAAITSVGQIAYVKDNFTLTTDPKAGIMPLGLITKFYSTTKAEVKLWGFQSDARYTLTAKIDGTLANTSNIFAVKNPLGKSVALKDYTFYIATAASSAVACSAGIGATSTAVATNLVATGALTLGTSGIYGPAQTTNFLNNLLWSSSQWLTLSASSGCSTAGGTSTLVAYVKLRYEIV